MTKKSLILSLFLSLLLASALAVPAEAQEKHAAVIKINDVITPAIAEYISRSIEQATKEKAACLIIQMDTPGGLDLSMRDIIKCRPPENRNPEPDEIAACEPFLVKQLKVIQPKLICALGTFAAQTLLQTAEKISALRGRFHSYQGILLMPTYHPAFLLRNPNYKRDVWEDVKKVKAEYEKL